jgi:formate dehydrogenase subunit delta
MANQIADNFDYGSDRSKAVAGVLDHLVRFWTPTMKQTIVEQQKAGNIGLNEIAAEAVKALADTIGQAA